MFLSLSFFISSFDDSFTYSLSSCFSFFSFFFISRYYCYTLYCSYPPPPSVAAFFPLICLLLHPCHLIKVESPIYACHGLSFAPQGLSLGVKKKDNISHSLASPSSCVSASALSTRERIIIKWKPSQSTPRFYIFTFTSASTVAAACFPCDVTHPHMRQRAGLILLMLL